MTKELEVMLNEAIEPEEVEYRVYLPCPKCERRIYSVLFEGHACCCYCRGYNAYGMIEDEDLVKENEDG